MIFKISYLLFFYNKGLHLFLNEGSVNDIAFTNGTKRSIEIGWFTKGSVVIPCFNNIESALGTNRESIDLIGGIGKMI